MSVKQADIEKVEFAQLGDSGLPPQWTWSLLGKICKTSSGGTPSRRIDAYFKGDIPWVKSGELPDGPVNEIEEYVTNDAINNSSAKVFPKGTLLIALYGATVGKLGILTRDAATNQAVCAVFPPEHLDTRYLFWYLRYVRSDLIAQAVGGAQPNISQSILHALPIPVAPLDHQIRIVAEIEKQFSRLDEAVANLKRVKANLKRYKAAVLKAAVEGKLTEEWRKAHPDVEPASELLKRILAERRKKWETTLPNKKYKESLQPNTAELPTLPTTWAWATVEQVNKADRPCSYGVLQPGPDVSGGTPFIRVGDINDGRLIPDDIKRINPMIAAKYPRTKLSGGEVLITLVGAIGRTAVVPETYKGANTARAVGVIPVTDLVSAYWVELWFRNPAKVREMTGKSHEVARKTLNLEDVKAASVALPPAEEQKQILAEVEQKLAIVNAVDREIESNLLRADRLRQSILRNAFTGHFFQREATHGK